MYEPWGVGALHNLFGRKRGRVRDFRLIFRKSGLGQARVRVIFSGFQPPTSKTLRLGQTKARDGFSTLKIGGRHVFNPWDPPLSTPTPPSGVLRLVRACACLSTTQTPAGTRTHLPRDPSRGTSGRQKWVPRAENRVSPYFEGAESISGTGLTQFQGFKGDLGRNPENGSNIVRKIGSKSWLAPSKSAEIPQKSLTS